MNKDLIEQLANEFAGWMVQRQTTNIRPMTVQMWMEVNAPEVESTHEDRAAIAASALTKVVWG